MLVQSLPAAAAALAIAASPALASQERAVLGEYFTANWSDDCAIAGPVVDGLIDEYPDTFVVVQYHVGDDGYDYPWGNNRAAFYADPLVPPAFHYDGLFDASPYDTYESKFIDRQVITTDLHIDIIVDEVDDDTYSVRGQFCIDADGTAKNARLYAVQVLDNWPADPDYSRNTFKQAGETMDLELQPGLCAIWFWEFTLDADSLNQLEDVKFALWAQDALDSGPAEVFQARIVAPFIQAPCPADVNGDTEVNIDDLFATLGAWGACNDCPEDVTEDGLVNIDDVFEILGAWGPCP